MSNSKEELFIAETESWTLVESSRDGITISNEDGGNTCAVTPQELQDCTECLSCRWINHAVAQMPAEDGSSTDISESPMTTEEEEAGINHVDIIPNSYRCLREQCCKLFSTKIEYDQHERKHLSRFFCTFDTCFREFESQKDWKMHEWRNHAQNEMWRCQLIAGEHSCAITFKDENEFTKHLLEEHEITKQEDIRKRKSCDKIAKKWYGSYWCGFCEKIYSQEAKTLPDQYAERNNHISKHFEEADIERDDLMAQWYNLGGGHQTKRETGKKIRKDWEGALVRLM